jgi:hypothetical protein
MNSLADEKTLVKRKYFPLDKPLPLQLAVRTTIEFRINNRATLYQNVPEYPQLCWGDEWPTLSPGGRGLG